MTKDALHCRWLKCPSPGPFSEDNELFEHLNDTHNGRPGQHPEFVCHWEGCKTQLRPGSISSRSHRARHIIIHTGYRPFVCERDGCGAAFRRKEQYKDHVHAHSRDEASDDGSPAQTLRCETCPKTFLRGSALKTHTTFAHASTDGRNGGRSEITRNLVHGGAGMGTSRNAFLLEVEDWSDDESEAGAKRASAGEAAAPDEARLDDQDTRAKLHSAEERIRELEARQAQLHAILRGGE